MAMLNRHNLGGDVSTALLSVGFVACTAAVRAAATSPAAEEHPVWLLGAFFGGLLAMWSAVWVAADAPRRRAAGQVILCAAFVPLAVAVGLSRSDPAELLFDIIDAMV